MTHLKIGIRIESLGLPLRKALQHVASLGVGGVQVDAAGDLSPDRLSETGRREFRNLLRAYNLELTALGCRMRRGLDAPENQQQRIEHVRKVLSLSFDLGPRRVIVEAGRVPDDLDSKRAALLGDALLALARHGDRTGTTLALETGLESGTDLAKYLARFDTGSLGVNLDPANLMLHGFDVMDSTRALQGKIIHVHARDAAAARANALATEVPLGHGDIEWIQFLGTLEEVEYRGWIVIERETGENRAGDIAEGVGFLRRLIGPG